jgi:hypothetical protein
MSDGIRRAALYESMIDDVIVWSGFTSTSTNRAYVIRHFLKNEDSIPFEIALHPGNVAIDVKKHSIYRVESEILIPASTGFKIDTVEYIDLGMPESDDLNTVRIPMVKMSYFLSWTQSFN